MQNENHYLPDENNIPDDDIRKLPDRSNLSKIYFETNRGYQKGSVNYQKLTEEKTQTTYLKKLYAVFIPIGVAIPGLIAFAILAYAFFRSQMSDKYSIMISLPFLASTAIIFALSTFAILNKINEKLYDLGISVAKFFIIMTCFLILSYEPAFLMFSQVNSEISSFVLIILTFTIFSVVYTWILLKALSDDRLGEKVRNAMIFVPLIICLIVTILANFAIIGQ